MPILTGEPHLMHFDLNEWQRIDRPGKYRLYVTSSRLTDQSRKPEQRKTEAITSNVLAFEVLPADEKWQREQLAQIVAALDTAKGEEARAAARRLRFLGTPESALELARHFNGSENDGNYMFGLYGLRDRTAAIDALRRRLTAADQPVTEMYLQTLGHLDTLLADATAQPPAPATAPDAAIAAWLERLKRREAATSQVAGELFRAMGKKLGRAKAVSVMTLLEARRSLSEPQREARAPSCPRSSRTCRWTGSAMPWSTGGARSDRPACCPCCWDSTGSPPTVHRPASPTCRRWLMNVCGGPTSSIPMAFARWSWPH